MIANTEAELLAMISADMGNAFEYVKKEMEEGLRTEIAGAGVPVNGGGIGDVEAVWPTTIDHGLSPQVEMEYNQGGLVIDEGEFRHSSPIGTALPNFADLITQGLGGNMAMFGGLANPTMHPRDFWSAYINLVSNLHDNWVLQGMKAVGMPVI